jgi:hypothetical protein
MADTDSVDAATILISPHFDDAVLSCGRFMAIRPGLSVLTALAGSPAMWDVLTPWDRICGFSAGDDVISARLIEDAAALDVVSAHQRPVAGLDSQYGPQPERAAIIRDGIESALADLTPKMCVIPLGLQHEDHKETRRVATLVAANTRVATEWVVYEELPYGPNDELNEHHNVAFAAFSAAGFQTSWHGVIIRG